MPFLAQIDESDYTTHLGAFLQLTGIQDYLSSHIKFEKEKDLLTLDIPRSIYRYIKYALQQNPEGMENPIASAFCSAQKVQDEQYQQDKKTFLEAVENFYKSYQTQATTPLSLDLAPMEPSLTFDNVMQRFLENPEIKTLILGDSHGDFGSLELLKNNAALLGKRKAILVVENLCDTAQTELERCFSKKKLSRLIEIIIPRILCSDYEEAYKMKVNVFEALIENSVRIVAGETEISNEYGADTFQAQRERLRVANYMMIKNVNDYRKLHNLSDDTILIYWAGQSHALWESGVPGLAELTGAVYLKLCDNKKAEDHQISLKMKGNVPVCTIQFSLKKSVRYTPNNSNMPVVNTPFYQDAKKTTPFTSSIFFSMESPEIPKPLDSSAKHHPVIETEASTTECDTSSDNTLSSHR